MARIIQRILKKLKHYGIKGNLFRWFTSYVKGRNQIVYANINTSGVSGQVLV